MGYECGPAPGGPLPPYQGIGSNSVERDKKWEEHNAKLEEIGRRWREDALRSKFEGPRRQRPIITLTALLLGASLGIFGWNVLLPALRIAWEFWMR